MSQSQTETMHLIRQALRELEIEGCEVRPSFDHPGSYEVYRVVVDAVIPMDCEYKTIIDALNSKTLK